MAPSMRDARLQLLWILAGLGVAPGCSFDQAGVSWDGGSGDSDGALVFDAPVRPDGPLADGPQVIDAAPDRDGCPGGSIGIEISNLDPCDIPTPGDAIAPSPGAWIINTDNGTMYAEIGGEVVPISTAVVAQQTGGPEVRVISTNGLTIANGTTVEVRGARPLVLVSFGDATIGDHLSVDANGARPGAGGNLPGACTVGTGGNGVIQEDVGSGAGGGAYGGDGGDGAKVAGTGGSPLPVSGGSATGNTTITPLRGGCAGGDGANNPTGGGRGGAGGGAIQLIVDGTLAVPVGGAITTRGGGASGTEAETPNADEGAGGGGGGSGGAILLEAEAITIDGYVTANGGGGSEATFGGGAAVGQNGEDGYRFSDAAAGGGGDWCYGGDGGNGGSLDTAAGDGSQGDVDFAGGGGGGGGVGRIHFNSVEIPVISTFAVVSPADQ